MKVFNTVQYDLQGEQWRDLVGFPQTKDVYWISNKGRIKRVHKNRMHYSIGYKTPLKYRVVDLIVKGKTIEKGAKMHRLVFEAFYRKLFSNEIVHHLSHVKDQNQSTNLVGWDESRHISFHNNERQNPGPRPEDVKRRISNALKGIKRSQQTKKKMSLKQIGKKLSPQTIAKRTQSRRRNNGGKYSSNQRTKVKKG